MLFQRKRPSREGGEEGTNSPLYPYPGFFGEGTWIGGEFEV
jgi:hypothetical protein